MNRFDYTKDEEQIRLEKFVNLIFIMFVLFLMLLVGIAGALYDAHATAETPTVEENVIEDTSFQLFEAIQQAKEIVEEEAKKEAEEEAEKPLQYLGNFKLTAYCICFDCCRKRPDDVGYGITATGTRATQGRTIAVDNTVIPLGTKVVIDGHEYTAEDTGGAIKGNRIDIYLESHEECLNFGVKYKDVYISKGGDVLKTGKQKPIKEKCHWDTPRPKGGKGCKILDDLQCEKRGRCGFFETTAQFEKR